MPDLNRLGSPYLSGILDAAEEEMLLLETTRGCVFNCKFCYYPKSYDKQYYLSDALIRASLRLGALAAHSGGKPPASSRLAALSMSNARRRACRTGCRRPSPCFRFAWRVASRRRPLPRLPR